MDLYTPGVALAAARIAELHRQAGLLDHYDRMRREETRLRQARMWANTARRYAIWALCSSGGGILLAVVAPLT